MLSFTPGHRIPSEGLRLAPPSCPQPPTLPRGEPTRPTGTPERPSKCREESGPREVCRGSWRGGTQKWCPSAGCGPGPSVDPCPGAAFFLELGATCSGWTWVIRGSGRITPATCWTFRGGHAIPPLLETQPQARGMSGIELELGGPGGSPGATTAAPRGETGPGHRVLVAGLG